MEVTNSVLVHHLLQLTGSIGAIACIVTAFHVPWAHPKVPISRGLYEIDVPIDIGLLRCFSPICKQYENIEKFLIDSNSGHNTTLSSTSPVYYELPSEEASWHLPLPSNIKSPIMLQRDAIRKFVRPYRTASFVTITFLALSTIIAVYLTVLIFYRLCSFHYSSKHPRHSIGMTTLHTVIPFHNLLLVLTLFTMFLATMSYLILTCSHLNGGRYVDGVWITAYCCICGLLCCLISAILKEPRHHHRGVYTSIPDAAPDHHDIFHDREGDFGSDEEETHNTYYQSHGVQTGSSRLNDNYREDVGVEMIQPTAPSHV